MKIGFLTPSWGVVDTEGTITFGGSGWYRSLLPGRSMERYGGHQAVYGEAAEWDETGVTIRDPNGKVHSGIEILVFQSWLFKQLDEVIPVARSAGQIIVCDVDDYMWNLDKNHVASRYIDYGTEKEFGLTYWDRALHEADAITTSTTFLYNFLTEKFGPKVHLLKNMLDINMFYKGKIKRKPRTVGWVGGIPWRSGDLEKLAGIIGPFLEKYDLQFFHCGYMQGFGSVSQKMQFPRKRLVELQGLPIYEYPLCFQFIDIGVVPLKFNDFNEAKSCLKGMEYSASGVPFIADSTLSYREYGEGMVCRTKKQWNEALEEMMSFSTRKRLAEKAYQRVLQEDCKLRWREWEQVYVDLLYANH